MTWGLFPSSEPWPRYPMTGIVGCCALQIYSQRLAEIRSLAVQPDLTRSGVGSQLVLACKTRAKERGVKQVMAVTSSPAFFETLDFSTFKRERIALFHDVPHEPSEPPA